MQWFYKNYLNFSPIFLDTTNKKTPRTEVQSVKQYSVPINLSSPNSIKPNEIKPIYTENAVRPIVIRSFPIESKFFQSSVMGIFSCDLSH